MSLFPETRDYNQSRLPAREQQNQKAQFQALEGVPLPATMVDYLQDDFFLIFIEV